jgi:hypothetical protein
MFPQVLGPGQPGVGVLQQPESHGLAGPNNCFPDRDEWAEIFFLRLVLLHDLHSGISSCRATKISLVFPQSRHVYSKIGMVWILLQILFSILN